MQMSELDNFKGFWVNENDRSIILKVFWFLVKSEIEIIKF